jgi:hypothetical protein
VVDDADLLDAGVIFGTGFAPFRGGPIQYARSEGVDARRNWSNWPALRRTLHARKNGWDHPALAQSGFDSQQAANCITQIEKAPAGLFIGPSSALIHHIRSSGTPSSTHPLAIRIDQQRERGADRSHAPVRRFHD